VDDKHPCTDALLECVRSQLNGRLPWKTYCNVDYKVLRASTDSLSPLRNIPPPEQNTETRGTNIKTGPFVRAERGKDDKTENETEGD
jgi:hypothetical protein